MRALTAVALALVAVAAAPKSAWHSKLLHARALQETPSPSPTPSMAPSPSNSVAASNSVAPSPSNSGTAAVTPTPSNSRFPSPSGTGTSAPSVSSTNTPTPTSTLTRGASPSNTPTPSPSGTGTATASAFPTRSTTPSALPSRSAGATPSSSPLPPVVVAVVQEVAGVSANAILQASAASTVGQALRAAMDNFVRRTVDVPGLRVLITAIIDALSGAEVLIDANHPLNQGARLLAVVPGRASAFRGLQSGSGFRVRYAIVIPPVNTQETGTGNEPSTGAATRNQQLSVAAAVSSNLTAPSRQDALANSASTALTTIATAVGVPASQVTTQVRTDSVVVSAPPTGREADTPYTYPGGAIAGIVLGVLGGVGLILGILYFSGGCKRKPQAAQPIVVEEWQAVGAAEGGLGGMGSGSLAGPQPVQAYVLPPGAVRYGV